MHTKRIGLALGSGAARGMAHIGVLRVLKEEGIPIDVIAGTSMGAVVGAAYAIEGNITRMEEIACNLSQNRVLNLVDLTFAKTGMIGGRKIIAWGKSLIGRDLQFVDLKTPFACVATDIMSGQEIVFNKGSVLDAVRASISIPGAFAAVKRERKFLVDGGLVNPVPVSIVRNMGADVVIAVNVMPDISDADKTYWMSKKRLRGGKAPNILEVLMQSVYILTRSLACTALESADVVIEPRTFIGPGEFHKARECILEGELAAEDAIPKIKRFLA